MFDTLRSQVLGINRFLHVVYDENMRLSRLLRNLGFTEDQVVLLTRQHIQAVVDAYLDGVRHLLASGRTTSRAYEIVVQRYGLDGGSVRTLRSIGEDHQISHEAVQQLQGRAMAKCRRTGNRRFLEKYFREAVERLLLIEAGGAKPRDLP